MPVPGRKVPDKFDNYTPLLGDPGLRWQAVTKDDNADLPFIPRAVYVGNAGDMTVVDYFDRTTLIPNVPGGSVLPGRFKKILASGTTASGFVLID
ncbi:MAG: hypothetical protein WCK28_00150 [Burkholderiales bacterium]|jgi:hypothetical protein